MSDIFKKYFNKHLMAEFNVASAGGAFGGNTDIGSHGGAVGNSDWYAPGDARIPGVLGADDKPEKKKKKKRKKTKKESKGIPVFRRRFTGGL